MIPLRRDTARKEAGMGRSRKVAFAVGTLGWVPTLVVVGLFWGHESRAAELQERTPIKVTRIFTGPDNQTHAEEYEVTLGAANGATELAEPIPVESLQFRRTSSDYSIDWHNAPRRQYVITLAGEGEVELGDGTKVRLYPGHILLAEDTSGQGHISRAIGDGDRISLFIPLADR
jgi:uncharacterized cupin superfamily protein